MATEHRLSRKSFAVRHEQLSFIDHNRAKQQHAFGVYSCRSRWHTRNVLPQSSLYGKSRTERRIRIRAPLEFQARCIVILIEESSRKALLNMLIAAGRVLDHPLRLSFNYTTALSPNPDLAVSSMNCAIGNLILENYQRDAVGQQLESELLALQSQLETKNNQVELFDRTVRGLSAYRPPGLPPHRAPRRDQKLLQECLRRQFHQLP